MEIYTDSDQEYYEKIASMSKRELLAEVEKWRKKLKKEKIKWTYGSDWKTQSGDDLYFLCIEINRTYNQKTDQAKQAEKEKKR